MAEPPMGAGRCAAGQRSLPVMSARLALLGCHTSRPPHMPGGEVRAQQALAGIAGDLRAQALRIWGGTPPCRPRRVMPCVRMWEPPGRAHLAAVCVCARACVWERGDPLTTPWRRRHRVSSVGGWRLSACRPRTGLGFHRCALGVDWRQRCGVAARAHGSGRMCAHVLGGLACVMIVSR